MRHATFVRPPHSCLSHSLFKGLTPTAPAGKVNSDNLPKPTNLRIEDLTSTSVYLLWDPVEGATDYDINYKRAVNGKWTILPHRGTATESLLSGLEPNTEYRWAVKADRGQVKSKWAIAANFTTLDEEEDGQGEQADADSTATEPDEPTNLRVEAITDTSARVRWDAIEGATDYDVNYKKAVGGRWTNEPHKGTRLYNTIYDLEPNTEYRWAVRAGNKDGASAWVFAENFTTLDGESDLSSVVETLSDSLILVTFYASTGGPDWTDNTNWLSEKPLGSWYGIHTNGEGHVKGIDLYSNYLVGTLPPSLGGLDSLRYLQLEWNRLRGSIPSELGDLDQLESVFLGFNFLTGSIPAELGQLGRLRYLWLRSNELTGIIPPELGQLGRLESLELSWNQLTGNIPPALGDLKRLNHIYLGEGNSFVGCVPSGLLKVRSSDIAFLGLPTCGS